MKKMLITLVLILVLPTFAAAAAVDKYQVTGPVLEVTDSTIVVQKGNDRWELARDKDTKVDGDLKVGDKVTIKYRMTATKVEVKESKKAAAKETKKPGAKEETKPAVPAPAAK
jgi:ribosomal 50S subunit-recycling heat shock protein